MNMESNMVSKKESPYAGMTDAVLIKEFKSTMNDAAFKALFDRYENTILSIINKKLKNIHDAEDVKQEVYIRVLNGLKGGAYTEEDNFAAWIATIARNTAITFLNKKNKQDIFVVQDMAGNAPDQKLLDFKNKELDPEELLIQKEELEKLAHYIDRLSDEQRAVVERVMEGMMYKEIAEELGININTALARFRYAVLNMKKFAGLK